MFERVMCAIFGALCVTNGTLLFLEGTHGELVAGVGDMFFTMLGLFLVMMAGTLFFLAIYYYRK